MQEDLGEKVQNSLRSSHQYCSGKIPDILIIRILKLNYQDTQCSIVEDEECKTITEQICDEVQYVTKLDSYGNIATQSPLSPQQDVDSYGAPLAPPVQQDIDGKYFWQESKYFLQLLFKVMVLR